MQHWFPYRDEGRGIMTAAIFAYAHGPQLRLALFLIAMAVGGLVISSRKNES